MSETNRNASPPGLGSAARLGTVGALASAAAIAAESQGGPAAGVAAGAVTASVLTQLGKAARDAQHAAEEREKKGGVDGRSVFGRIFGALFGWLTVLALVLMPLGGTAQTAPPITELNALSAQFTWTPATGPVSGYEVWVKRGLTGTYALGTETAQNKVTISGADGEAVTLWVRAFSANKATVGPNSPESDTFRFHAALGAPGKPSLASPQP